MDKRDFNFNSTRPHTQHHSVQPGSGLQEGFYHSGKESFINDQPARLIRFETKTSIALGAIAGVGFLFGCLLAAALVS